MGGGVFPVLGKGLARLVDTPKVGHGKYVKLKRSWKTIWVVLFF